MSALDLIDATIADLEGRLNLKPGEAIKPAVVLATNGDKNKKEPKKKTKNQPPPSKKATANTDQPDICKLEFKVGVITKVWVHPEADKLYCEEIDVGEAQPRHIASGLRPHFTEAQMLGQKLLVVSNLKAKNLVGFKSHGMVLCAADGSDKVEFVEPPEGAMIGEVVTFQGLPPPEPFSPAQVDKKKVWQAACQGLTTTADKQAAWNGHVFLTSAGPCTTKTIAKGVLR